MPSGYRANRDMEQRTNAPLRRILPAIAALLGALALAGPAAAQNLGAPDSPPGATPAPAPTEVAPAPTPAAPAAATPPTPAATPSDTPDPGADPAAPADDAAAQTDAEAQAAAAVEHVRALRAAAQRKRIRANIGAVRDAALEGGKALAGTRQGARAAAAAPPAATPAAVAPVVTSDTASEDRREMILAGLLGAAALGLLLVAYPAVTRRGGALQRVRLEIAGVSVACVLVLLLVLAGVV